MRRPGTGRESHLSLAVHLDAGLPLAEVESLYHQVSIEEQRRPAPGRDPDRGQRPRQPRLRARLDAAAWRPRRKSAVFAEEIDGDSYLAVTLVPPDPALES